jgi:seryl-tRNA synthetase
VRFELQGAIVFSADVDPVVEALADYLAELQAGPLQRGVPEGEDGPVIEAHSVEGHEMAVTIVSGRYVRAHEALLRLRKELSALMGREHRIGVRAVRIERYVISFSVSEEPKGDIRTSVSPSPTPWSSRGPPRS